MKLDTCQYFSLPLCLWLNVGLALLAFFIVLGIASWLLMRRR